MIQDAGGYPRSRPESHALDLRCKSLSRNLSQAESNKKSKRLLKTIEVSSYISKTSPATKISSHVRGLSHKKSNKKSKKLPKATTVTKKTQTISSSKKTKAAGRVSRSHAKPNYDMRFHPMDEHIPPASVSNASDAASDVASSNASDGSNSHADLVTSGGELGAHVSTACYGSMHSG